MRADRDIDSLLEIMVALRTPGSGCPWDLQQDFASIAPYTIEEAYEVADAIARGDLSDLRDELGDLLLQVVFHARMAEEAGAFDFGGVVQAITEKLIRRHPHVFGDLKGASADEVAGLWQRIKAEEKAERAAQGRAPAHSGVLADVPAGLPALARALKLQEKASTVGFDWGEPGPVLAKIAEEAEELRTSAAEKPEEVPEELGDLLFAVVNLARHYKVDPESALRSTNAKFERRFAAIEAALAAEGRTPGQSTLAEMDALWDEAKRRERGG
ncbi:MAG TPA: nucleoside triphosphate pyrophosphohydrolase [Xanthobacteraceae bacterium]